MKKGFKIFDYSKPGKGVKKSDAANFTFGGFFKLVKRKFFDLSKVNLLWVAVNFPLIFAIVALSGNFSVNYYTATDPLFAIVNGVELFDPSPDLAVIGSAIGQNSVTSYYGPVAQVLFILSLLTVFTFGLGNAGMAYVIRNHAREEYVDMPGDFFRTIKKNFLQAMLLGIIDIVFSGVLVYDILFFDQAGAMGGFIYSMFYFFSIFLAIVWVMMRFYMYQLLVTFKLSTFKILKNSFIFALVGFKRNIVALIGIVLVLALNAFLLVLSYTMALGGLLPFFITVALLNFIATYAAYPNIKRIMIDPYYKSDEYSKPKDEGESLFQDVG